MQHFLQKRKGTKVKVDKEKTHAIYIVLDEKRILKDNEDLIGMKNYIETLCNINKMIFTEDGWYINGTFETVGAVTMLLSQLDWFIKYIKEWYLYDDDDKCSEDLVSAYKEGVVKYVNFGPNNSGT